MGIDWKLLGTKNKANGDQLEELIKLGCNYYRENKFAHIEKTPEAFHMTGQTENGMVIGYYEKKAQPDFKGAIRSGMAVMFDAKHTNTDRIMQSAVTEEQAKSLNLFQEFGAHCFIVVSIQFRKYYRVPWNVWKEMKARFGHKYMNEQELAPYEIRLTSKGLMFLGSASLQK